MMDSRVYGFYGYDMHRGKGGKGVRTRQALMLRDPGVGLEDCTLLFCLWIIYF